MVELPLRHQRQLGEFSFFDVGLSDDDRVVDRAECHCAVGLLLNETLDDSAVVQREDRHAIVLADNGRWIEDVLQDVIEVRAIGAGDVGADLASFAEQDVTGRARLRV